MEAKTSDVKENTLSTSILPTGAKQRTSAIDPAALEQRFALSDGKLLDLSSLELVEMPPLEDLNRRFPHLRHLNIRRNALRVLPEGLARAFPGLVVLNASENALESLSYVSISALRNLQRLNIAHNCIREVPAGLFIELDVLEEFDARGNLIQQITFDDSNGEFTAAKVSNLQVLLLADNRLKKVALSVAEFMPKLRAVDLSGNPDLTDVPENIRRLHGRYVLFRSSAKRRELITRALNVRKAVALAQAKIKCK
ncbi:FOG: Leucine rich repeat [Plasmopara halstedii]|uniref:FOG: Leucine rich repeat n=1 Tax=Plasmopara halstedii TaxID=4781 RepID=A0A0P1B6M5_PLAHL|nr:FOG: Leucine rich repeat [Plasmopara halstedii]CEG50490.1 FOG: Leucine rich repeat [Plasmopara halstedii]|eukprot:XP_024586859.1 FOG: Leucine rich repeat [Plasmopara halstedii]